MGVHKDPTHYKSSSSIMEFLVEGMSVVHV